MSCWSIHTRLPSDAMEALDEQEGKKRIHITTNICVKILQRNVFGEPFFLNETITHISHPL